VKQTNTLLNAKQVVFWDFDGVIKDSVVVKSRGYEKLFLPYGREVVSRVNKHHEDHGGISRYKKIPLYLSWAGELASPHQVQAFCDRFSKLVQQAVIDSPWVPGVQEYLRANCVQQCFILITATPQEEIEKILNMLNIACCFREVHGAPKTKATVVNDVLKRLNFASEQALVIGDSGADLEAAEDNNVAFLLRCTQQNHNLQEKFSGPRFENLKDE
jgi:phosphoglycolate phosphatase-like HAD superfamily hydrolase